MPGFVSVLAFAWSYWRRHGRRICLLALMLAGATLAEISIPVWIGRLIDALGASEPSTAVHALVVILALSLTFQVFHKAGDYLWCRLAIDVMRQIGADAFARVQRYSTQWHANTLAGATVRKITRGIWAFDDFGDALYISLLPATAVVLGVAILTAVHWPLMGMLLVAGAAAYTAISTYMASAYVSPRWRYAVEADSRARRLARRRHHLHRRGQDGRRRAAGGRAARRTARGLAAAHGACLVGRDRHGGRAERDHAVALSRADRRRALALVAGPGDAWRRRLRDHELLHDRPLPARRRHPDPHPAAGDQRSRGRSRLRPHPAGRGRSTGCRSAARCRRGDPVRARALCLSGQARAGVRRAVDRDPLRRESGPGRPLGQWQEHAGQAAAAALRPGRRPHHDRRPGHRLGDAGEPAPGDRAGAAGAGAVPPLARREHRLRPPGSE